MSIDPDRLEQFVGQWIGDMGAASSIMLAAMGDRLGLYRAMVGEGLMRPSELAAKTGCPECYLATWMAQQAASGYLVHEPEPDRYALPDEQAAVLAAEDSPVFLVGAAELITSLFQDQDAIVDAYRDSRGFGWHEHSDNLFSGVRRFFSPRYDALLTSEWIPSLTGVEEKLRRGARVADIGCGHGVSTCVLAQSYPASAFSGFDNHPPSIKRARELAESEGVSERASFEVASADDFPGAGYDLVCLFDCLHDTGDPVGVLRHIRRTLAEDGTVLLVEPQAGETVQDNLNPVGRVYYAGAATICVPCAVAQDGAPRLHTQSPEADHRAVAEEAGFTGFRKATETMVNRVFELRI